MSEIVYSLKKRKDTDELHLFRATPILNTCLADKESICKKMDKNESQKNIFDCQSEKDARLQCAEKGRKVCGICVSHLYSGY